MFSQVSGKTQKDIAFLLYVVMGIQLVLPAATFARSGTPSHLYLRERVAQPLAKVIIPPVEPIAIASKQIKKIQEKAFGSYKDFDDVDGPSQPEMRQFSPVGTSDMVDLFTGDFSYNIPLLDVGGYPVNISYDGNVSMDQESSWVGLGWNINPGAINRNMRGLPDDFNGSEKIIKTNRMKPHTVVGGNLGAGFEFVGFPLKLGLSLGAFYNSKSGWGTELGINPSINLSGQTKGEQNGGGNTKGGTDSSSSGSLSLNLNLNSQEGVSVSPSFSYDLWSKEKKEIGAGAISTNYNSRVGLTNLTINSSFQVSEYLKTSGSMSFARTTVSPTITMPFSSANYCFNLAPGGEIFAGHVKVNITGYYSKSSIQLNDQTQRKAAYGYMFYDKAANNDAALLDFNRDKEAPYRDKPLVQNIAIPSYTYDAFSMSGQGNQGMFRAFRGDIGYTRDHYMKSKSQSFSGGLDLGAGAGVKWGGNFSYAQTTTTNSSWKIGNGVVSKLSFSRQEGTHEAIYFRNPGESIVSKMPFGEQTGADKLVAFNINRIGGSRSPIFGLDAKLNSYNSLVGKAEQISLSETSTSGNSRERRNQVISYLTADEAVKYGQTYIASYDTNYFQFGLQPDAYKVRYINRKDTLTHLGHHISMVNVLNSDGRRYEYGIPVYNLENREVTYSLRRNAQIDRATNLAYSKATNDDIDNITKANLGYRIADEQDPATEQYFMRQITPAYSHSFLLTGVYSPDYMDATGDGPTEDDYGDGIQFRYSQIYGTTNPYRWRTPMHPINKSTYWSHNDTINGAVYPRYINIDSANGNYEEGLKTDYRDDKASYVAGAKETWYLNSIESKSMVAIFIVERRLDATSQINELGGNVDGTAKQLLRLKEIRLYSKADFTRNGSAAKPVKTVHFEYDYSLCRNYPLNTSTDTNSNGKLTLKKIWFTYNNNKKGQQNPYRFYYRNNQPYQYQASDNWGNYKDPADNPGLHDLKLNNKDYPYPVSDQSLVGKDVNVAPWALDSIHLPSGSNIKVTYEADDYGFVQNKRALQLFKIEGLGKSNSYVAKDNRLYENETDANDHRFVFVKVPTAVSTKKELFQRYLEGLDYIYFRLNVLMPNDHYFDIYNKKYEFVKLYSRIKDGQYGIVPGQGGLVIWFEVEGTERKGNSDKGYSPLTKAAIQFLRTDVPMKAYPGSAFPADKPLSIGSFASSLIGSFREVGTMLQGFHGAIKKRGECKYIDLGTSFVRLASPGFSKKGGGYRVKKVVIHDNWNAMTSQHEATYGQQYTYTTSRLIDGKAITISSGVSTYEPFVGGEENPYKFPIENYNDKSSILGPANALYTEGPLMESFYPAASVGYSRVRVQSIHNQNIKSRTGWDETRFYTSYDYPVIEMRSPITDGFAKFTTPPALLNPLKCVAVKRLAFSQGFKIELNDMNGKLRSQASYAAFDSINPISSSEYFYKSMSINASARRLDNAALVIDTAGHVSTAQLGRDIELMTDFRQQESTMFSGGVNLNAHVFTIGIFPVFLPAFLKFPQFDYSLYQAAAVNKIINRHGILDSVVVVDKGSKVSTENLAYDAETGGVLVTRTRNEFDDPIYNVTLPAHWAYDRMGSAAKNIDFSLTGVTFFNGVISNHTVNEQYFVPGDEVLVYHPGRKSLFGIAMGWDATKLYVVKAANYQGPTDKAYINPITTAPGYPSNGTYSDLRFVDQTGILFTALDATTIKIVRSGRRNMPALPVGTLTSLVNPIVNGMLQLDEDVNMLNVDATEYREDFKTTPTYWITDSCNQICQCDSGYTYNESLKLCVKKVIDTATLVSNKKFIHVNDWNQRGVLVYPPGYRKLLDFAHSPCTIGPNPCGEHSALLAYRDSSYNRYSSGTYLEERATLCHIEDPYWTPSKLQSVAIRYSDPDNVIAPAAISSAYSGGVQKTVYIERDKLYYVGIGGRRLYTFMIDCDTIFQRLYENQWVQDGQAKQYWHIFPVVLKKGIHRLLFYGQPQGYNSTLHEGGFGGEIYDNTREEILNAVGGKGLNIIFSTKDYANKMAFTKSSPEDSLNDCVDLLGRSQAYSAFPRIEDSISIDYKVPTICQSVAPSIPQLPHLNPYVMGILGNYRPFHSYTYYKERKEKTIGGTSNIRTYGTIDTFRAFWTFQDGWLKPTYQADWVWNSESTLFHRKGDIIESRDPLGRYTAGQYGYNNSLPVAVSQNSKYREAAFDGFEDYNYQTDNSNSSDLCQIRIRRHFDWSRFRNKMKSITAHSGYQSLELASGDSVVIQATLKDTSYDNKEIWLRMSGLGVISDSSAELPIFMPTLQDSMVISVWVKETGICYDTYDKTSLQISFRNNTTNSKTELPVMKPTGLIIEGWQKIEGVVKIPTGYTDMNITLKSLTDVGKNAYFDDIRMHPYHANMKCFVYDPVSLRLMAELDENNYASFYEYDDDGTLVRVKKETEKGIKTIKETRSALIKE